MQEAIKLKAWEQSRLEQDGVSEAEHFTLLHGDSSFCTGTQSSPRDKKCPVREDLKPTA